MDGREIIICMGTRACTAWCVLLAACPGAFGLDPALDVSQYAHKAWTVRDGFFKGSIYAIAQTPDGYLWLGTEFGLERFDGVRSLEWQPPKSEHLPGGRIRSLLAARDGRLWIGTDEGLASWKDGKLTHYAELAGKIVLSILEDHEATIWAGAWAVGGTEGRLCTIRDGRVQCSGNDGSLRNGIDGLYEDRGGNLWAGTVNGVWRWKPEPAKFFPMAIVSSSFAEGDGGELFIATLDGIRRLVNEQPGPYLLRAAGRLSRFGRLLRDRDGGLWVGTYDGGLLHVYRGRTHRFTHSEGLSDDNIQCLFQDREGSIWVGTRDGLDRFREFAVPAITAKQGLSSSYMGSILYARDGSIWLGTLNGLDRWKNGNVTVYGIREGLPDPYAQSLFEDRAGRIWVSTRRGIVYWERGKFVPVPGLRSGSVVSIVGDDAGDVWISDQQSLYHLDGQTVVEEIPWTKLGHKDFAWILLPDPVRGGLWLGFRQGGVAYYKDHSVRLSYGRERGFGEGQVSGLKLDEDGAIWAAKGDGLNLIRNGQTFRLSSANGLPCDMVHWVLEDNNHFFWLYTACGLVRVARSELERWVADPKKTVSTTVFDSTDGVRSSLTPTDSNPEVAKSADGKIWFLPKNGVSVIDPQHLPVNKLPPPVHIEQIIADRKVRSDRRLPPLTRDLEIEYTALSLVAPEKNQFKYKLEGYDRDWQDAGNRRQAFYTNLPPGNYRFRVMASNNSGVWNEAGTFLDFAVGPAYYQTVWFRATCVAALVALLWGLYRLRLHQVQHEFGARMEERTRIARELHDTLLQTFHGLMLRLQVVDELLPLGKAKEELEETLDRADQAIIESRNAVHDLRSSSMMTNDLAHAVRTLGQELASGNAAIFRLVVEGEPRDLHPIVRDEFYRIAREALRNAFRHAGANHIEAEITYSERLLRLRIRDDGQGIPQVTLEQGRSGHYGLPGMRERARKIDSKLTIWSRMGAGTEIDLSIAGLIAYSKSRRSGLRLFGKKVG